MERSEAIIAVGLAALMIGAVVFAGLVFAEPLANLDAQPTQSTATPTPTPEPTNESDIPEAVMDSQDGAADMKRAMLDDGYNSTRVFIQEDGTVVATYQSNQSTGSALKDEMRGIAMVYSDVKGDNPNMGGLTVVANGIQMHVSEDAALAHSEERLQDDAYAETFAFESSGGA